VIDSDEGFIIDESYVSDPLVPLSGTQLMAAGNGRSKRCLGGKCAYGALGPGVASIIKT